VSGRPAAVGGTAHGYGSTTNYRVSATATALIRELSRTYSLTLVSEWPIEQLQMHCVLFRIPPGTTREAVIEKLRADKRVRIVQPLNEFESASAATPAFDDPYARLQTNVSALDVAEAHHFSRGTGVRVAIIDTGVDTRHPDLAGRTQLTRNYIDNDDDGFRNDRHGTQVAGLIAAAANNGVGIVGVAPDVHLMAFKACWQPTPSASGRCNSFTLAQALADALAARAQIINLSLVGPSDPHRQPCPRGQDRPRPAPSPTARCTPRPPAARDRTPRRPGRQPGPGRCGPDPRPYRSGTGRCIVTSAQPGARPASADRRASHGGERLSRVRRPQALPCRSPGPTPATCSW
jgi:subtilisin family serine protease